MVAAKAFPGKPLSGQGTAAELTLDFLATPPRVAAELGARGAVRKQVFVPKGKFLINAEQARRRIGQFSRPKRVLGSLRTAIVVSGASKPAEKMKKERFKTGEPGGRRAMIPELWQAEPATKAEEFSVSRRLASEFEGAPIYTGALGRS